MKKLLMFVILGLLLTILLVNLSLSYFKSKRKPAPVTVTKAPEVRVTVIEGWTLEDIGSSLANEKAIEGKPYIASKEEFLAATNNFNVTDYPILNTIPKGASLEGFIFPDTYFLPEKAPTSTTLSNMLISKALNNFENKFTREMETQSQKNGLSVYETVILASIVERETGRNAVSAEQKAKLLEERKIVAGIFYNRLAIHMALGSDATINYITKKNTPQASSQDLEIKSPYNTYKNAGLPPGPIGSPSLSSLLAVLYPTKTDYFYFLHKQPSGEVVYSKTFEEHIQNKNKYLP